MAISTYAELQTAIGNWLHRSDLTTIIPDFITLAESRINRNLRLLAKETETDLTATVGSRYIAIPSNFIEAQALYLTTYQPREKLLYVTPAEIFVSSSSGTPRQWTLDGSNIALDSSADIAYTLTFRFWQSLALSASSTTNWLLTNHPDIYLYGALIEAMPYIKDDERVLMWKSAFDTAIEEVQQKETRSRALGVLNTGIGAIGLSTDNIFEG